MIELAKREALEELKRALAATLVKSGLDYTDNILILNAFFRDFRWQDGFTPEQAREQWRELLSRPLPEDHVLSLYIHVPYCVKKCHFCYCSVHASPSRAMLENYVPELKREIDFFAPTFRGQGVRLLQIGGGTPNLLSSAQLEDLLKSATSSFRIDEGALRTIEFNPSHTDREKLAVARRAGFNRISFGVQSLNARVLENENREYQTYEMIRDALAWSRELGFEVVNVDLLLGLDGDTVPEFLEGFRRIAELRPTMITVTGLSLTDAYIKVMETTREKKLRRYEAFLSQAIEGLRALTRECGYGGESLDPWHANWTFVSEEDKSATVELLRRGDHFEAGTLSILGLGQLAWSHAFGQSLYERSAKAFAPQAPLYRRAKMTWKEELTRHMLYALELRSRVDFEDFRRRFREDVRERFRLELGILQALGKIRFDEAGFEYLPARGPERIFYGAVLLLDTLAQSPFSSGALSPSLLERVARELAFSEPPFLKQLGSQAA